jgi:hypothetical protein
MVADRRYGSTGDGMFGGMDSVVRTADAKKPDSIRGLPARAVEDLQCEWIAQYTESAK